ncbi:MAG TPA: hypothetical protein VEA99_18225 [Gemmatimonadaceae bacterium]|nr:hypothetical protein [Gemmatimonadaceae bacterium]
MPSRQFTDSHGHSWTVWDVLPSRVERELDAAWASRFRQADPTESAARPRAALPVQFAGGWLCFERVGEKRRLAPVPRAWERLSLADLEALCAAARPVASRLAQPQGASDHPDSA